ncbi:MAG: HesA/MoeB/ThiF family protein [Lutibacter sp.]|uniref:HesA/MoeB/ThiF family protein n=1 Tax=Lutibacter sp. TaxID=1925666 RepID=UPI00299E3324|nr:HesA/MoeB/ThiF family protein [Lutibacter sp.]MDX1828522.1 HesA/MoeB/ThiF family protein [Lutibacter sp.]
MNLNKESYFQRQTTLSEIGEKGQVLLQKAKVLVVGCGGLGSPIAIYLATSGIGELHLVDFDTVSVSNLHRQVFYKVKDVGQPKAEILAEAIKERAPFTKVTYTNTSVEKDTILNLVSKYDVIVEATDNLPIKYLINDACVLTKKPVVYGSLYKFDGYVATFNVKDNQGNYSCNLRDAFPKITTEIPNCEEAGTLNPIVGIIALMQVNEVIKLITKKGNLLVNQLLIYNALENSQFKLKLKKNNTLNISEIFKESDYLEEYCESQDENLTISVEDFKRKMTNNNIQIISILNHTDFKLPFKVHQNIPYKNFDVEKFIPNFDKEYIIVCKKGITSYDIALRLKEKYPKLSVLSLSGGTTNY